MTEKSITTALLAALMISCTPTPISGEQPECPEGFVLETGELCARWTFAPSPEVPREAAALVRVDENRMMFIGGIPGNSDFVATNIVDLLDRRELTWTTVAPMSVGRVAPLGVKLASGNTLIVGGLSGFELQSTQIASAEVFSPSTKTWAAIPSPVAPHTLGTATALDDGRVLVVGGYAADAERGGAASDVAEVFDETAGAWSLTAPLPSARLLHSALTLGDGSVLVVGGTARGFTEVNGEYIQESVLFEPASSRWLDAGSTVGRHLRPALSLLDDGTVLLAGGDEPAQNAMAEIFDPQTRTWILSTPPAARFERQSLIHLADSSLAIVGGPVQEDELLLAERYDPIDQSWKSLSSLVVEHDGYQEFRSVEFTAGTSILFGINTLFPAEGLPSVPGPIAALYDTVLLESE